MRWRGLPPISSPIFLTARSLHAGCLRSYRRGVRIESTRFEAEDLRSMLDQLLDRERLSLVARLETAAGRLREVEPRLDESDQGNDQAWSAVDILAHIAMFTSFYAGLTQRIASGAVPELAFLRQFKARDVVGQRLARRPAKELLAMASGELAGAIEWLREATPKDLRVSCKTDLGDSLSTGEIVRLPLCAHLELHLDQLERTLRDQR
jgi:hypothetical protein